MTPAQRAQVIYTQARAEMSDRLWRAAIGTGASENSGKADPLGRPRGLDALLGMLQEEQGGGQGQGGASGARLDSIARLLGPTAELPVLPGTSDGCSFPGVALWGQGASVHEGSDRPGAGGEEASQGNAGQDEALEMQGGPNARYAPMLREAAQRTGLPPAALATIVHAEAARSPDGRWLAYSRNPRSSAAGLGQFLNDTWVGEAERAGTWLHDEASQRGWLDARGRVVLANRADLLALRYDPHASIEATADFARANLDAFQRAGIGTGGTVGEVARMAYLGHHLGRGDAIRFLTGALDPNRARTLLNAQIGQVAAARRIEAAGGAVAAHRSWLLGYVERTIRTDQFQA